MTCIKCALSKEESEFGIADSKTGRRKTICVLCARAYGKKHYIKNRKKRISEVGRRNRKVRKENTVKLIQYLKQHVCVDCGISNIIVLEFDHVRGRKTKEVSKLVHSTTWPRVLKEIEKCDIVCANCHKIRTAKQFGWRKMENEGELESPKSDVADHRLDHFGISSI